MSDIMRRAGDPRAHLSHDDEAELARRIEEERLIDAQRAPEKVLLILEDPYADLDGPRSGSSALRRLEDGGSF